MASLAAAVSIRGRCLDPAGGAVSKALSMAILNFGNLLRPYIMVLFKSP